MDLRSFHVCKGMYAPSSDVCFVFLLIQNTVDLEAGGRVSLPVRLGSRILATVFPVLKSAPGSQQASTEYLTG